MVQFRKISGSTAADVLAKRLNQELTAKRRVLWLVSGGSNITITVETMKKIPAKSQPYLAIMLSDERFGPCGHKDSNLQQLHNAGFAPGQATVVPVLMPEDPPLAATVARYQNAIKTALDNADVIIAQLGIGSDGHVAGILPGSPAASSRKLVFGYETEQFSRITLTFAALKKVTADYSFAFGTEKLAQLETLRAKKLPLARQPAQILKQIKEAYVYNDQIGTKGSRG